VGKALFRLCVGFCVLLLGAAAFAGAATNEYEVGLLAEKTRDRLNAYYNTTAIVFEKGTSGPYGNSVYYVADYWKKTGVWVINVQLNIHYSAAVLSMARMSNGFMTQYSDTTDWVHIGFECPREPFSTITYFVYARASKQFAYLENLSDAITGACLDFQAELAKNPAAPSLAAPSPSPAGACVLQGGECCRGVFCRKPVADACVAGEVARITGCDAGLCSPIVLCEPAPQPQASEAPSAAPVEEPSVAPSVEPSFAASAAPSAQPEQRSDFSWLWFVLAVIAVAVLVYWLFGRGKPEHGAGAAREHAHESAAHGSRKKE